MIRVRLTADDQQELRHRTRQAGHAPAVYERLEMVRLSGAGWTIPQIAQHLGRHEQTVRAQIKAFVAGGFDALPDQPRAGRPRRVTDAHLTALTNLLDHSARTWTTRQLATWLAETQGVAVHPDYLATLLHQQGFRWNRMKRSVAHKQRDPDLHAAKVAELEALKKGGSGGGDRLVLPR
jgi:transposase